MGLHVPEAAIFLITLWVQDYGQVKLKVDCQHYQPPSSIHSMSVRHIVRLAIEYFSRHIGNLEISFPGDPQKRTIGR